ncbi:[FeFe] hydrogenase H-cluster maturation GTPase HydF [Lachnoclostridium phytofermentans]|uniref:Small GTP-binding protein n=1 Tax=Lachnoclostridium phytofermentans (strain ATCC 700394 / DSM 18823 / ISDg) TaxID=357809 RepID=A9KIJ7_LACP7|nr:[FeFe] hydrogenase H-cluster maturation GTPase HydF [Lachnoclostridium phytofermentans]ABX42449.1 small GTP-binding protein [Lachnoclostridium phytofermentans ISDg]
MSLNETPLAERIHIGIFGKRNAGKSSLLNALTGQNIAIVSDVLGTTTDPVLKTMELLPLGPVVFIDTPGFDDDSLLGKDRVEKSFQMLRKTNLVLVIIDTLKGKTSEDIEFISILRGKKLPYLIVYNKKDLAESTEKAKSDLNDSSENDNTNEIYLSAKTKDNIDLLKTKMIEALSVEEKQIPIVADLISPSDFVVLVVPIDKAAPKGRLILPQQQTIRDILDANATAIVVKEHELKETLLQLGKKPKLVITDSQVFKQVDEDTPKDILLTSFSILFARYKGDLDTLVAGVKTLDSLKDGDKVLISEGCTHHRQCNDIGSVKLPNWIHNYTGKNIDFEFTSGSEFPTDLSTYQLIVHCGGCMLNEREMKYRLSYSTDKMVPITNYGILIAYIHGILKRSLEPFPKIHQLLEDNNIR